MLERVWRKGNPLTLLVGMQIGAATMENSVKVAFKKLGIELPYDPSTPPLGIYPEKLYSKRYMHPRVHSRTIYNAQDMETT